MGRLPALGRAGPPRARWGRRSRLLGIAGAGSLLIALLLTVGLVAAHRVPLPERLSVPASTVVAYRDGTPAHIFLAPDDRWRLPVSLEEIDQTYLDALFAMEDRRFRWHPGVDPLAIARATLQNAAAGRRISGASTLTMQLVRLLEPRPRTLRSKVVEALRAMQLTVRLSKDEVLRAYLEHLPFGGNVEGLSSAAWAYFGHSARHLSAAEVATLLAIPQSPEARQPEPDNHDRLRAARDAIVLRLADAGALPLSPGVSLEERVAQLGRTPVPNELRRFPREAPHAARWLVERYPERRWIETTLDASIQRTTEALVRARAEEARRKGIDNAATVVMEHASGELRALVGGFDFHAPTPGAQIPAFDVPRSSGSTLKPFLYAMAIDAGRALPERLVPDVPLQCDGWAPENFDGRHRGLVRLSVALTESLNVPFVGLLDELGVEPVLGLLRTLGAEGLVDEPGHYGLSLAIGGAELTALELAGLYGALAQEGRRVEPRILLRASPNSSRSSIAGASQSSIARASQRSIARASQSSTPGASQRRAPSPARARNVISPGASWLTRDALTRRDRPDFPGRGRWRLSEGAIHWKTGTSYGFKDAWAVGSDARYTAAVWMGNLNQRGSVHLVGAQAAGPLLFDVLEALSGSGPPSTSPPPADLTLVEVCADSGHVPTAACPRRHPVHALRRAVPPDPCPYHRAIDVERSSGRALTAACRAGRDYERRSFTVWPTSVRRWMSDMRGGVFELPPLAEGCRPLALTAAPRIRSPEAGEVRVILPGLAAERQEIPLYADADGTLSWFVDGRFVGRAPAHERLWWAPTPGSHEVWVEDEAGRSARRRFEVTVGRSQLGAVSP